MVRDLAQRLGDRQRVSLAVSTAPTQTAYPRTVRWHPPSLAQGDAGLALTCAWLDACFPDEQWDRIGHMYLTLAAETAEESRFNPASLFGGLAGLGFAAWSLSRSGTRYRRLLSSLDAALLERMFVETNRFLGTANEGIGFGEFDAVSGVSGIGGYLLHRLATPTAAEALAAILRSLVELADEAASPPRWWTPVHLLGSDETAALYPFGNLNCGLAHGIPGPIACMALASLEGMRAPGIEDGARPTV